MSTTRTFTPLTGNGGAGEMFSGSPFEHVQGEIVRQALDIALYTGGSYDLGGSDDVGQRSASYVPVIGARDLLIDGDSLDGLDLDLILYTRTADAGTSVTARLRNLTDSTDAAVGTTITATTLTQETITAILASGPKVYRLEQIGGNADDATYAYGQLRVRKVPA